MKVLLISHMPPPTTGISGWTKRLLQIGLPGGWEIVHVNSNTIGGRDPFSNTKRRFSDEYRRSMNIYKQTANALKKGPDIRVVHTCIPCTPFGMLRETIAGMIAKKYGKKFILHCRCTVPNVVNRGWKRMLWKLLTHYCDGVMVLNQASLAFSEKYSPECETVLIPNFVTESELTNGIEKEISGPIQSVIFVGGVTPEKGCDTIIRAAARLPQIQFHLLGAISDEIKAMEKTPNVLLHGNHERAYVKEQLRQADCFLFLSRYFGEGFSNALAEAMAAGLPCVVTDWAANADMIGTEGGRVIPQMDTDALVQALEELSANPELRKAASIHNVEKVKSTYVERVVVPQYTAFYEKLVNQN